MAAVSENVYIDKLSDIVEKYNNTDHRALKAKPLEVKKSAYIDCDVQSNDKDPKCKFGNHARMWKC